MADEGRLAIVTNVRWDAVDAEAAPDERGRCVRRSRVVLPLPNKFNAMRWLTGILRALNHLAIFSRWLTQ